ncbi:MAG: 3-deoxy-manno-octulosonate cytidylyltransferase [Vampirovibrionales bacterium]
MTYTSPSPSSSILAVIPARYGSTRFPAKPLALLKGKPMIEHTWRRVTSHPLVSRCVVATDHPDIFDCIIALGGEAMMTSPHHASGSDRIWEVASQYPEYPWVLNVQGDEPYFPQENLDLLLHSVAHQTSNAHHKVFPYDVLTLATPFPEQHPNSPLIQDPHKVKAVLSVDSKEDYDQEKYYNALYFSRAVVPHVRDTLAPLSSPQWFWHMGVYLYQRAALEAFTTLPVHPLETLEGLEQLRLLANGYRIGVGITPHQAFGVDTPEDLAYLNKQH